MLLNHERERAAQPRLGRRVGRQDAGRDVREGPLLHLGKHDWAETVPGSGDFTDHHDDFRREPGHEAGKAEPEKTGHALERFDRTSIAVIGEPQQVLEARNVSDR